MKKNILTFLLIFAISPLFSQVFEVFFDKDFSSYKPANQSMGVRASIGFDGWSEHLIVKANFGWAKANPNPEYNIRNVYQKFEYRLSAHYILPFKERWQFQAGGGIAFVNLKNNKTFSENSPNATGFSTIVDNGYFIGISAPISLHYYVTPRIGLGISATPTYNFLVSNRCSYVGEAALFDKNLIFVQLEAGLIFKFSSEQ